MCLLMVFNAGLKCFYVVLIQFFCGFNLVFMSFNVFFFVGPGDFTPVLHHFLKMSLGKNYAPSK